MPPMGLEPTISAGERSQTYALERAAAGTGRLVVLHLFNINDTSHFHSIVIT
jgi:hypothetical protein